MAHKLKPTQRAAIIKKARERSALSKYNLPSSSWQRAMKASAEGNYTLAARYYKEHGEKYKDQDALDLAQGMLLLCNYLDTRGSINDVCSKCGHARQEHILILACIQCTTPDGKDSTCRIFSR